VYTWSVSKDQVPKPSKTESVLFCLGISALSGWWAYEAFEQGNPWAGATLTVLALGSLGLAWRELKKQKNEKPKSKSKTRPKTQREIPDLPHEDGLPTGRQLNDEEIKKQQDEDDWHG